jgi:hypothetical protein
LPPTWIFCSLHLTGLAVYGFSILFFVVLLSLPGAEEIRRTRHFRFLSWGPVLGLSMGALIAGGLGLFYQQNGAFVWGTGTHEDQMVLLKHLSFLVLWISHFHLEIWTQDPLRKLTTLNSPEETAAWETACRRVGLQLRLNAAAFVLIGVLAFWI